MTSPTPDPAASSGTDPQNRGSVPVALVVACALVLGAGAAYFMRMALIGGNAAQLQDSETSGAAAMATASATPGGVAPTIDVTSAGTAGGRLKLTGTLDNGPITLGTPGTITISAHNTTVFPLALSTLGVLGVESSEPNCRADWLHLGAVAIPDEALPPGGTVVVRVPYELVDLPSVNQDACKGASFRLKIGGTGERR